MKATTTTILDRMVESGMPMDQMYNPMVWEQLWAGQLMIVREMTQQVSFPNAQPPKSCYCDDLIEPNQLND